MGRSLHESLHLYFSRLRRSLSAEPSRDSISSGNVTPGSWLLSACRYPKTASFAHGRAGRCGRRAASLSDVDGFLFENVSSLYRTRDRDGGEDGADDDDGDACGAAALDEYLAGARSSPPRPGKADPSPSELRAPRRSFASSGSPSECLPEDTRPSAASCASSSAPAATVARPPDAAVLPGNGVAVQTFSVDPYEDFRRSMLDMVDARREEPLDWDFMKELLVCYLELNDRGVHSHILRAFTDVAVAVAVATQRRWDPPPEAERVGISEVA